MFRPVLTRSLLAALLTAGSSIHLLAVSAASPAGEEEPAGFSAEQRSLWSFQKPLRPPVPSVREPGWVRNPIDAFVLAQLEAEGLGHGPLADKRTLIRRVTFDLIGLPPTPEEVAAFEADESPDAYESLVDRLLRSPHLGERWARLWLDLARYAESDGFKTDGTRPHAWRYRDYVIESFNADKPYDLFIREQIAGDEIAPESPAALIATGFNRHWPDEDNARNLVLRRQEILNDITDTTASVFLGLTLGCARCHDHKFDPILQTDYYRFQAFFAAAQASDLPASRTSDPGHAERLGAWEEATAAIRSEMAALEEPVRQAMRKDTVDKFVAEVQGALAVEPARRTPLEQQLATLAEQHLEITMDAMVSRMPKDDRERWTKLRDSMKGLERLKPPGPAVAMALTDVGPVSPPTFLLERGIYNAPGREVVPGFLSALDPFPAAAPVESALASSTGRRTALANWIASPDNPFTARVIVNRLWQAHFDRGIVGSASDFGLQGDTPTHPALLDWLAAEFASPMGGAEGRPPAGSLKAMHRLMVTSSTYRQASRVEPSERAQQVDPDNTLLWRMNGSRLEAEMIRDAMLAASGQLNPKQFGPSVLPELPPGLSERYGWKPSKEPSERNRRSVYVFVRRNLRYPLFEVFDMPDTNETCGRRNRTTTAPQALHVLNSEIILAHARSFAGRVLREVGSDEPALIQRAYRLALARDPSDEEVALARAFLKRQAKFAREQAPDQASPALPDPIPEGYDALAGAALADFCHALLNANEFIYID